MDKTILTAVIVAAISFIMQKTLSNLLYGFVMLVTRPFKRGDKISVRQADRELASGKLIKRTPLHIYVKDYGRDVSIIPNSVLENCTVVNSDYKDRVNYTNYIKISFSSNIAKTKEIIQQKIMNHTETLNREDNTHIVLKTEDGGLVLEYNVRTENVDKSFDVCSEIKEGIVTEIQKHEDIQLV